MDGVVAPAVRVFTFFWKELRVLLSQHLLVGSLVLGPFLILLAFGLSFRGSQPNLSTVLVVPNDPETVSWVDAYTEKPIPGFNVIGKTASEDAARQMLIARQVDLVVIIPPDIRQRLRNNERARLRVIDAEVDPAQRDWVSFNSYVFFAELNNRVLEEAIRSSNVQGVSPEVVVRPFEPESVNLSTYRPGYVGFYAPGVLALLIQHLGVTLGALALIRERLGGAVEVFRVSPVSAYETIIGKSLAYGLVLIGVAAILAFAMVQWLGVPTFGPLDWLAGTILLLVASSLGLGFAISSLSNSELQAVQFSMLILLASVFFSGFFVPLANFFPAAIYGSWVLPVSHGVSALQDIMLRGYAPPLFALGALAAIAVITYIVAILRFQGQLRLD